MKTKAINDAEFDQDVLKAKEPVLVDFWADWCGPCKMIAPFVEELAGDYDGKLKVMKMDVDANPRTAMQYGIRSIPTLLLFNNGRVVDQIVGAVPKRVLVEKVAALLEGRNNQERITRYQQPGTNN